MVAVLELRRWQPCSNRGLARLDHCCTMLTSGQLTFRGSAGYSPWPPAPHYDLFSALLCVLRELTPTSCIIHIPWWFPTGSSQLEVPAKHSRQGERELWSLYCAMSPCSPHISNSGYGPLQLQFPSGSQPPFHSSSSQWVSGLFPLSLQV